MTRSPIVRASWIAAIGFFVGLGAWPFIAPRSFYEVLATFPPYNAHLFHDLGAFTLGIGGALVAAAFKRDGMLIALIGAAVAAVLHLVSHIIDSDLGGKPTDIPLLALFAVVMVAGAIARNKEVPG